MRICIFISGLKGLNMVLISKASDTLGNFILLLRQILIASKNHQLCMFSRQWFLSLFWTPKWATKDPRYLTCQISVTKFHWNSVKIASNRVVCLFLQKSLAIADDRIRPDKHANCQMCSWLWVYSGTTLSWSGCLGFINFTTTSIFYPFTISPIHCHLEQSVTSLGQNYYSFL